MQKWRVFAVILALLFAFSSIVSAFSIGPVKLISHLGEKFNAEIPVEMLDTESSEKLSVAIGTDRDYQLLGSERVEIVPSFKTSVVPSEAGARILIQSDKPVNERSFDLVISATLDQGTILKKYIISLLTKMSPARNLGLTRNMLTQPDASASTKPLKTYGPVLPGENLLQVARKISSGDQEAERVAVALWKANRQAFVEENIHGLMYGTILNLQGLDQEIAALTIEEAKSMLDSQWKDWISLRVKVNKKVVAAKKTELPKGMAEREKGPGKENLGSPVASEVSGPQPKSATTASGAPTIPSNESLPMKPVSLLVTQDQATSPTQDQDKEGGTLKTTLADQEKAPQSALPLGAVEQPIPATPVGVITQNVDKTMETLKEQLAKIKKDLLMLKARLFEIEGQSQNLRQQLTYLFYFTMGENLLLAVLALFYFIRRRKSGERMAEALDSETLWFKK